VFPVKLQIVQIRRGVVLMPRSGSSYIPTFCHSAAGKIDSDLVRRQATELSLFARGSLFDFKIWTDGSVTSDGRIGAGAALMFEGVIEIGSAGAPSGQFDGVRRNPPIRGGSLQK
jgi:hypothetical protein